MTVKLYDLAKMATATTGFLNPATIGDGGSVVAAQTSLTGFLARRA